MHAIFEIIAGMVISIIALIGATAGVLVCYVLLRPHDDDEDDK